MSKQVSISLKYEYATENLYSSQYQRKWIHHTKKNMVSELDLKVTQQALAQVRVHPAYPSLLSITEVLQEWNAETLAVKISSEQLKEIPFPAISHLRDSGNFIVVNGCYDDKIEYVDSRNGLTKEAISKCQNKWSGRILYSDRLNPLLQRYADNEKNTTRLPFYLLR